MVPISVSTDLVRPAERHAFWTEAICRSFANVETRPIGPTVVSGHFEFVEIGSVKLVRFDSSPQCYRRDAKLVSKAGSDEFMFDFQRRGQSSMTQAGNYAMVLHYLKALEALGGNPHDGAKIVAKMKEIPTEDPLFGKGTIQPNGRTIHSAYLFEVKKPSESKSPWDFYKLVATIPADEAFIPLEKSVCSLVKKS